MLIYSNFNRRSKALTTANYYIVAYIMDDDLDDYKLETTWGQNGSHVIHTSFESDCRQRGRKVRVENKWYQQKELGVGSCSVVHLETAEDGQERAVKSIRKSLAARLGVDYRRELAAISTFSKAKVDFCFPLSEICLWISRVPSQHCDYNDVETSALLHTSCLRLLLCLTLAKKA